MYDLIVFNMLVKIDIEDVLLYYLTQGNDL